MKERKKKESKLLNLFMHIASARNNFRMPIRMVCAAQADCALELDGRARSRVCLEMRERDLLHKILICSTTLFALRIAIDLFHSFALFQRELHNSNEVVLKFYKILNGKVVCRTFAVICRTMNSTRTTFNLELI